MNSKELKYSIFNFEATIILTKNQDRKNKFKSDFIMKESYLHENKIIFNKYEVQCFFLKDTFSSKAVFLIDYDKYYRENNVLYLVNRIQSIGGRLIFLSSDLNSSIVLSALFKSSKIIKY
jgi:hypothetical protein